MRLGRRAPGRAGLALGAALVITLVGGLLRLDALHQLYGPIEHPGWARVAWQGLAPVGRLLRPSAVEYQRVETPYVGGDPINYLAYAREMTRFYQAHVREPVYLVWAKLWLWLLDDQDIGISYASATASALAILATYLLGAAALSPAAGLIAAAAMAVEMTAVKWSVEGWRDDTYMLFVTLTAWRLVILQRAPTRARGVAAGVAAGLTCLTRLSALVLVAPVLAWVAATAPRERRAAQLEATGIAVLVTAALLLPYLIACAKATGDPFYAVNYHTAYYDHRDDGTRTTTSAMAFLRQKFAARPVATLDTALEGLVIWPLRSKFDGLAPWHPAAPRVALVLSVAGIALAFWCPAGRLLLIMLVTSLAPYMVTWSISDGGAWRFSAHVYPIYLVGAAAVIVLSGRLVTTRPFRLGALWSRRKAAGAIALAATAALLWTVHRQLPWWIERERLASGDAAMIVSGNRDAPFFEGGWSRFSSEGNVSVRAALAPMVDVQLPIVARTDHELTVRMDPPEGLKEPPVVAVFLNGHHLGDAALLATPGRIGTYRFAVPADLVGAENRLRFISRTLVNAGDAGARFTFLPPDSPVAFRLWYVRVQPRAQ
jgi:4-amino-4-deoxy-L-arabinose transferase-like glycosyltransferase